MVDERQFITSVTRVLECLYRSKAMRACDLQPLLNLPEEEVVRALKSLVADGSAESYEHQGQTFYLRALEAA